MKKPRRTRRARNKLKGAAPGALVPAEPQSQPFEEPAVEILRLNAVRVARPTLFTAELEEIIEIIARDRVYRSMLARLGRRLLISPPPSDDFSDA